MEIQTSLRESLGWLEGFEPSATGTTIRLNDDERAFGVCWNGLNVAISCAKLRKPATKTATLTKRGRMAAGRKRLKTW